VGDGSVELIASLLPTAPERATSPLPRKKPTSPPPKKSATPWHRHARIRTRMSTFFDEANSPPREWRVALLCFSAAVK